jgi:hypothetical protein
MGPVFWMEFRSNDKGILSYCEKAWRIKSFSHRPSVALFIIIPSEKYLLVTVPLMSDFDAGSYGSYCFFTTFYALFFLFQWKLHTHCEERCFYLLWLQTRILVPKVRGKGSKIHSFALSRQQWKGKKKKSTHGFAQWTYVNFDKTNNLINSVFSFKFFLGSSFFFSSLGRKLNGFGKCREQVCVYFMRRSKTTEFSLFMIKVLENNK